MKTRSPVAHRLSFAEVQSDLAFLGLVGLIDPPRDEVIAAIAHCRTAGVGVKMITGDHAATAEAIARQLGLDGGAAVVTGHGDPGRIARHRCGRRRTVRFYVSARHAALVRHPTGAGRRRFIIIAAGVVFMLILELQKTLLRRLQVFRDLPIAGHGAETHA